MTDNDSPTKLLVHLRHCYGICELTHEFDTSKGDVFLIYAPNGAMKTSFAKTFADVSQGTKPSDLVYPDRPSECSLEDESGQAIEPSRILVIEPYDEKFASQRTGSLMVNEALRIEYEQLTDDVNLRADGALKHLATESGVSAKLVAETVAADLGLTPSATVEALDRLATAIAETEDPQLSFITYAAVFHPKVQDFLRKSTIQSQLVEYIDRYRELLSQSRFFRESGFNHTGAANVSKSLEDAKFFEANHSVVMVDRQSAGTPITSSQQLLRLFDAEKRAILEDPELLSRFEKIDSEIARNKELRTFRDFLENNRELLPKLADLSSFKESYWLSCAHACSEELTAFRAAYENARRRIGELAEEAKNQETEWRKVVDVFHDRFDVPFRLSVVNQEEVILRQQAPSLVFQYDDGNEVCALEQSRLLQVLSTGEKRALYLLNVIFEISAREKQRGRTVLVLDDVADSFDYKNKYAIVEYLSSISAGGQFVMIVLTHNFDFYRTVQSRLGVSRAGHCLMAVRGENRVDLSDATYVRSPLAYWRTHLDNELVFIATVPMVRNLVEYSQGQESDDYSLLTAVLHATPRSEQVTTDQVADVFNRTLGVSAPGGSSPIRDRIIIQAEACCADDDTMKLENKVVLSIAIRMLAENHMIGSISDKDSVSAINSNQTRALYRLYSAEHGPERILERVLLMTPEAIHLNSFMYEPILDMSIGDLISLYADVRCLSAQSVNTMV